MGDSNNVINLNGTLTSHIDSLRQESSSGAIPELILSARRIAKRQLDASINRMFNNADDCLFEYADKADNNRQQNLYFDAMRELRMLKGQICKGFFLNFESAFSSAYTNPAQVASSMNINSNTTSGLTLVEEDDLEESLAITQMSQRIYSECRDELSAMVVRFNEIANYRKFTKEANPLCPDIICGSFHNATEAIESSIEIKLIVFKLFDKFVVQNINNLYQEINASLIAAGVLPTIKYATAANDSGNHNSGAASESAAFVSMLDDAETIGMPVANNPAMVSSDRRAAPYSYDAIHQAFQHYRANGHQNHQTMAQAVNPGHSAGIHGPGHNNSHQDDYAGKQANAGHTSSVATGYYVTHDIINGLSRLQTNGEYTGTGATLGMQANGQIIKTGVLSEIARFGSESSNKVMEANDADVIDIVSMMFDYILNDDRLPDRIKLAIGRLQIPIVKLAIIDKTFFAKKTHPARELLNELAFANLELAAEQEDNEKILGKIDYIVECILNEFDQDSQIFEDLLIEFREFLNTEQKVDLMAKDMLLNARKTVVATLQRKIENFQGKLPPEIQLFILGPWKEVLNLIAIRDDCNGESWESATSLVDVLLWSIQAKLDAKDRNLLTQNIPNILLSIHEGIALIDKFHQQTITFIKQLEGLHLNALRSNLSTHQLAEEDARSRSEMADYPTKNKHTNTNIDDNNLADEILAETVRHETFNFNVSSPEIQNSSYFDLVRDLPLDTWLEFKDSNGGVFSGKLTWKSNFTGDYVFMNRRYKPVADVDMCELIKMFENRTVKVINNVPLLDQAIDSVIKCLNNCVGGWKNDSPVVH